MLEGLFTAIEDVFPHVLRKHKKVSLLITCVMFFILGIPMVSYVSFSLFLFFQKINPMQRQKSFFLNCIQQLILPSFVHHYAKNLKQIRRFPTFAVAYRFLFKRCFSLRFQFLRTNSFSNFFFHCTKSMRLMVRKFIHPVNNEI